MSPERGGSAQLAQKKLCSCLAQSVDHKRHEFIAAWDHTDNEEGYNRDKAG